MAKGVEQAAATVAKGAKQAAKQTTSLQNLTTSTAAGLLTSISSVESGRLPCSFLPTKTRRVCSGMAHTGPRALGGGGRGVLFGVFSFRIISLCSPPPPRSETPIA